MKITLTKVGLLIAGLFYCITVLLDLDLFEALIELLHRGEKFEVDEFIIPIFIALAFVVADHVRAQHKINVENGKIAIYKSMMIASNHILNNFLNQMLLFKEEAEDTESFDQEILDLYDEVIDKAVTQIEALNAIEKINEVEIYKAVLPSTDVK